MVYVPYSSQAEHLVTLRDLLRFAVTRLGKAGLNRGTDNTVDKAAALLLEALNLPAEDITPWLDARLTLGERRRLLDLIEQRVTSRKPAQ